MTTRSNARAESDTVWPSAGAQAAQLAASAHRVRRDGLTWGMLLERECRGVMGCFMTLSRGMEGGDGLSMEGGSKTFECLLEPLANAFAVDPAV